MRLFSFLFFFLCAYSAISQNNPYQSLLLDKRLTENANAIVRSDAMKIELHSSREMTVNHKKILTVLNKLGDRHVRTHIGYDKDKKIKNLEIFIYDGLGNPIDHIKKKDFKDRSAVDGFSLYIDNRVLYYDYTPVQYPYTIEFSYEFETADTASIPSWSFVDSYLESVEKSRFEIVYDIPDLKPTILEKNLLGADIAKEETNNSVIYTANTFSAIKKESISPPLVKIAPQLRVRLKKFHYKGYDGVADNWKELGSWFNENLLVNRNSLEESTKIKIRNLVDGAKDDLEKARIIYKYVQDNTRYVSVQVGIGGLQPANAAEVDRVKYGDCKGLSNYAMALLHAVGVTSYYAVVEAGGDKVDLEEGFADLAQGNHIILAIPYQDNYYWIDCTSQTLPFGYIGSFTDDRKVLVIKPDGGEIVTTKAYLGKENYQNIKADYSLGMDGSITGNAVVETQGIQYGGHFNLDGSNREEVEKYYKNYWSQINNLKILEYRFTNNRKDVSFEEKIALEASKYASISGNRILFVPNSLDRSTYVPNRYRTRELPFEIPRGYLDEDDYTIALPKGYVVEEMPGTTLVENEFGYYNMSIEYIPGDHKIHYRRSFFLKNGTYPKEQYALYRDFRKRVSTTDAAPVVLIKTNS